MWPSRNDTFEGKDDTHLIQLNLTSLPLLQLLYESRRPILIKIVIVFVTKIKLTPDIA